MGDKNTNILHFLFAGRNFNSRIFPGSGKFSLISIIQLVIKTYWAQLTINTLICADVDDPSDDLLNTITQNNNIQRKEF